MGKIKDNDAYEEELLDYEEEDEKAPDSASIKAADSAKKGYVGIHSLGFRDFLLKPELLRSIVDSGFEHPSEGVLVQGIYDMMSSIIVRNQLNTCLVTCQALMAKVQTAAQWGACYEQQRILKRPMHEVTFLTEDKPKLLSQLVNPNSGYNYRAVKRWTSQRKLGYCLLDYDKKHMPYALFSFKDRQGNSETES